jgi:Tfp pilus assembly protein PilO
MIIKDNKWRNLIILFCGLFLIAMIFEIIPDYTTLFTQVYNLIIQNNELSEGQKNKTMLNQILMKNEELKSRINSYVSSYNENTNVSTIITLLYNTANKCNISITAIRPSKIFKKNNLWLQPVDVDFSSNYENTFNFVKFIERSRKVIIVKQLSMVLSQEQKEGLDIEAKLDVYLNL